MNVRTIPRAAVGGGIRLARLPLDVALAAPSACAAVDPRQTSASGLTTAISAWSQGRQA